MHAFARVGVLVQRAAVELRETVRVVGEVRGHPVDDHADAGRMRAIDEAREAVDRPEARGRRELRERLVAPRAAERILGNRHEFDVREAHAAHVRDQPLGELVPGRAAVHFLGHALP
jgi:hypothetical protein